MQPHRTLAPAAETAKKRSPTIFDRRKVLQLGGMAALAGVGQGRWPLLAQQAMQMSGMPSGNNAAPAGPKADYELRIAPVQVELDPSRTLSTIGYNGQAPGPLLRLKAGKPVSIDLINTTDTPELVHWHGMLIRPRSTAPKKRARPTSHRMAVRASRSPPAPSACAGITRTPWRWTT